MASFTKIFQIPGQTAEKIYSLISTDIDRFLAKSAMGHVDIQRDSQTKKVTFKSSMASGELHATEGSLKVDVSLSFLASAFKGKIEDGVTKWLDKTFGKA